VRILVDADACPVKAQILRVARRHGLEVWLVACLAVEATAAPDVHVIRVDTGPQAADIALANAARADDVVVTGDYGVACMALGRRARALSFRGQVYDDHNIEGLMATRHLGARIRRGGGRTRGPKSFSAADGDRFEEALERLVGAVTPTDLPLAAAEGPGDPATPAGDPG